MGESVLLSICIPTRNRAGYLEATLASIVSQDAFKNGREIEVVISDNCSEDATCDVVSRFRREYGEDRIRYVRQQRPLDWGESFAAALQMGRGVFLKLNNDTLSWKDGALSRVVSLIRRHRPDRSILWFPNRDGEAGSCRGLDEFVTRASFFSTWIAAFGVWREELDVVIPIFRADLTLLPQTVYLLGRVAAGISVEIICGELFRVAIPARKGGYNIAQVFGHHYLGFLLEYVRRGALSRTVYEREKRLILLKHINPFYFDLKGEFAFERTGYFKWLLPYYRSNLYFYLSVMQMVWKWLMMRRKRLSRKLRDFGA